VGDQQDCVAVLAENRGEPGLHLGAGDRIERGERLIEQQGRPTGHQRAQEGNALAHPAGELTWTRALEARQPEALEVEAGAAPRLSPRHAGDPKREGGVVHGAEPRQEQVALWHVGTPLEALRRLAPPAHGDRAAVGGAEAGHQLEQRGLAAP
jgi:hypothetical protein